MIFFKFPVYKASVKLFMHSNKCMSRKSLIILSENKQLFSLKFFWTYTFYMKKAKEEKNKEVGMWAKILHFEDCIKSCDSSS